MVVGKAVVQVVLMKGSHFKDIYLVNENVKLFPPVLHFREKCLTITLFIYKLLIKIHYNKE